MPESTPDLSPALLATFLAVAEHGGVLPAARRIHLSQPAVTARIRQLEETLGVTLFLRSVRGMRLTPAGRKLRERARRIRDLLRETAREVGRAAAARETLVLAASTTLAAHVLPPLLARFQAARALPGIELAVGNTEQVLAWVRAGRAPLGLVEGRAKAPAVRLQPFLVDEIVPAYAPAAASGELRRAIAAAKTPAELAALPIVWREEGSGTRKVVEAALRKAGVRATALRARFVLGETEAIKSAVLAGLGIAFLSRCSIAPELAAGALQPIAVKNFRIRRVFHWALPGGGLSGAAAEFHAFARVPTG